MYLGLALVCVDIFAALGAYVAAQKRRDVGEGIMLGLLFGPQVPLLITGAVCPCHVQLLAYLFVRRPEPKSLPAIPGIPVPDRSSGAT